MKRRRPAKAGRILSVALSLAMLSGSIAGTGLSAVAKEKTDDGSLKRVVSLEAGTKESGWKKSSGTWYFIQPDGTMVKNTWKKVNGKWYFFEKDGAMAARKWVKTDGKWYYLGKSGAMAENRWVKYNDKWYCLGKSGAMRTGWILYKNIWYFLKDAGDMATGWRKIKGTWYYFDEQGRMYSNAYIDKKYFVDENGAWDGKTITSIPDAAPSESGGSQNGVTTITFHQDGWYVARLEVQVWDKQKQDYVWLFSDSGAKGQTRKLVIDTVKYDITRVGYQIWFFGWDNDYMNVPWANTDYSMDFTLSGSGDYPEFTWR